MIFDQASISDDQEIAELLKESTMPGNIEITFSRNPSFFNSVCVEGQSSDIIVGRDQHKKVKALGTRSVKTVFLHDEKIHLGYLSALRISQENRTMKNLEDGYEAIYKSHRQNPADFYITSINSANTRAQRILESKHFKLPEYSYIGDYISHAFRPRQCSNSRLYSIKQADENDLDKLLDFIHEQKNHYPLLPEYSNHDFNDGLLRALKISDISLCYRNNILMGCMGLWDQQSYKQNILQSYSKSLSLMRPLINTVSSLSHRPKLPAPGKVINAASVVIPIVADREIDIYDALLSTVLNRAFEKNYDLLLCGSNSHDPLQVCCSKRNSISFNNRIYLVSWEKIESQVHETLSSFFYLEMGGL